MAIPFRTPTRAGTTPTATALPTFSTTTSIARTVTSNLRENLSMASIWMNSRSPAPSLSHLRGGTANAVTAAHEMAGDVHVLVAGSGAGAAAGAAGKLAGVSKVLHVDAAHYDGGLPENYAALVAGLAKGYSHVVASASAFGKGFMPRVAAMLDVAQVSEISAVESADTFVRPRQSSSASSSRL